MSRYKIVLHTYIGDNKEYRLYDSKLEEFPEGVIRPNSIGFNACDGCEDTAREYLLNVCDIRHEP